MSNQFTGFGNVGTAPTLRYVGGDQREVAEMRVYFDRRVPAGEGFEDKGGFWLTVSAWGARAVKVAEIIKKGARIQVTGTLRQESWNDRESGAERSELRLTADTITIDPLCIESVVFGKRGGARNDGDAGASGEASDGGDSYDGGDVQF